MHVAVQIVAIHFVVQPLDRGNFLVRDGFAGQSPGEALQPGHHVEQLLEVALAELAHPGAAIGQEFDQALGGQHLERFTQRRSGNSQHFAELPLRNAGALRDVAFDHIVAKPQQDLAVQ